MKWWGWGDPDHQAEIPEPALAALRTELGAPARDVPVPVARRARAARLRAEEEGARRPGRRIVGDAWVQDDRLTRVTHAAGKSYPDLLRMRSGSLEHAPDAVVYPADAGEVRDVLEACVDEEVAVVPVRRRHQRRGRRGAAARRPRGRDQPRPGPHRARRRRRQALADRRAGRGPARARGRSGARRARPDARPLPAVVGVRDGRRLGRDALRRPGLDRLRRDRQARVRPALRRAGRRHRAAGDAGDRGRPGAAPAPGRIGGPVRRDHRGDAEGAAPAGARALRGMDVPRLRGGRGGVPRAGAAPRDPRRRAAVGPGRDAPVDDAVRRRLAAAPRWGAGTSARAATRAAASRSSASRESAATSTRAGRATERILRRARRAVAGHRARARVEARALRGPVPARRAARPRGDGGDARDRRAVVGPDAPVSARSADALRSALAGPRDARAS